MKWLVLLLLATSCADPSALIAVFGKSDAKRPSAKDEAHGAAVAFASAAIDGARMKNCKVAVGVAAHVTVLDATVHAKLVADGAVAHCLAEARETHAAISAQRDACHRARNLQTIDRRACFDASTVTIESGDEIVREVMAERVWIAIVGAVDATTRGDCDVASDLFTRAQATAVSQITHPAIARCVQLVAGLREDERRAAEAANRATEQRQRAEHDACLQQRVIELREADRLGTASAQSAARRKIAACPEVPPPAAPIAAPAPAAPLARPHPSAWELTTKARALAAVGDCEKVKTVDAQLFVVDAEFHAAVFAHIDSIAKCLLM
jgi:hypothetical protein